MEATALEFWLVVIAVIHPMSLLLREVLSAGLRMLSPGDDPG